MRYQLIALISFCLNAASRLMAADGGIGISPGVYLIQDAPLGLDYDLGSQGLDIQVSNYCDVDRVYQVIAVIPGPNEIASYEAGYEPLPDASWLHISHETVTISAHGTTHSGLTLSLPARADLANRRFMVFVEAGPMLLPQQGAVLRVRTRVLIETKTDVLPGTLHDPGDISLAPGRIEMIPHGDGTWSGHVEITNFADHSAMYDLLTLRQVYGPGAEDRRTRFFGIRQTGLIDQDWVTPDTASFNLAPGATRLLNLVAKHVRALRTGEQVDEVLFLARRASAEVPPLQRRRLAGADYERSILIRVRYSAPPVATVP